MSHIPEITDEAIEIHKSGRFIAFLKYKDGHLLDTIYDPVNARPGDDDFNTAQRKLPTFILHWLNYNTRHPEMMINGRSFYMQTFPVNSFGRWFEETVQHRYEYGIKQN